MKTPVIQCSPCYSAVSALLMNPLPDRSNYSPLLPHPLPHSGSIQFTSIVSSGQNLYQAVPLKNNTSLLQRFTAESSQEFRRNVVPWGSWTTSWGKCRFLILLFKLLTLSLFSLSLSPSAPFLNPLSTPSPPSFFLFWSIHCPPKIKTSNFITFCSNGTYFCILFHTMTYYFNNAFYKL